MTMEELHLKKIDEALSDMEAGEAGNDLHYAALKAMAEAVSYLLHEAQSAATSKDPA